MPVHGALVDKSPLPCRQDLLSGGPGLKAPAAEDGEPGVMEMHGQHQPLLASDKGRSYFPVPCHPGRGMGAIQDFRTKQPALKLILPAKRRTEPSVLWSLPSYNL